jgi:uncharacterized damage-inducible protein DinB
MRKLLFQATLLLSSILFFTTCFAGENDSLKAQMIKDWQRAKEYTKAYLDKMPADKYSYRPVDSIRSFAEQMLHLAQGNVGLVSNGTGGTPIFVGRNLEKSATAQNKDSVMYLVMASYDYCIDAIKNLDVSKYDEVVNKWNLSETRRAWILKGFEHQTHHRGQCTIYIRLQGITPPNEMLF